MKKQTLSILFIALLLLINTNAIAAGFDDNAAYSMMDLILVKFKPLILLISFLCFVYGAVIASGGEQGRKEAKGWLIGSAVVFILVAFAKPFVQALDALNLI